MGHTNKLSAMFGAFLPLVVVLSFCFSSQTIAAPLLLSASSVDDSILVALREELAIVPAATSPLPASSSSLSAANIAKFIKKKQAAPTPAGSNKARIKTISKALAAFYGTRERSPLWVSQKGLKDKSLFVLAEFENADDYGLRKRDFGAPQKLLTRLEKKDNKFTAKQLAKLEITISKTALRYIRYARGGRIDPRRLSRFQGRGPVQPDYIKALNDFGSTEAPAERLLSYHPKHKQFEALRQKLILLNEGKTKGRKRDKLRARLLINMERWRWMPEKMQGDNNIFVWANVPELRVRIVRNGKQVFAERAIAGQVRKQSPMFSDKMEWIEFNPTWFIPNSIKVADILPSLRRKGRVMKKYHLKINCGKYGTNWRTIDWKKVDIRSCSVIQPTGGKSVLGKLKFKFPNKYSVYMHDTLTPALFNRKHRILSHGCIRVRNPRRMAEVLLANDKGLSATRVGALLASGGLHTEHLKRSIPVHITYFSTRVQKNGSLKHFPDYYGHDKRLAKALLGKGHLFKGAIYGGRKPYKRKYKRTVAPTEPNFLPGQ